MNGNGVWRWLAAFLAGLVVALMPMFWALSRAPSEQDMKELQMQVDTLALALARTDEKVNAILSAIERALQRQ